MGLPFYTSIPRHFVKVHDANSWWEVRTKLKNPKTENEGKGLTFFDTLEGPLTCTFTLKNIQKVKREFGSTIGPSTKEDEQ